MRLVRDGHLTDGSIGYVVTRHHTLAPGASIDLDGRTWRNDGKRALRLSYEWSIREDSLTPIGADPGAKMRGIKGAQRQLVGGVADAFDAEGGYTLNEVYQDGTDSTFTTKGTWSVDKDGKTVLLDPEDKEERDRSFEITSPTELLAKAVQGDAGAGAQDFILKRR